MQYYILFNGQTIGPMDRHQMGAYHVNKDTMISAEGGDWRPLYSFPELMELYGNAAPEHNTPADSKRVACGVLALLIGYLGIQYFLIGKTKGGLINILLSVVTCGAWGIINFIQGIIILCMSDEQFQQKFVDTPRSFPIFG